MSVNFSKPFYHFIFIHIPFCTILVVFNKKNQYAAVMSAAKSMFLNFRLDINVWFVSERYISFTLLINVSAFCLCNQNSTNYCKQSHFALCNPHKSPVKQTQNNFKGVRCPWSDASLQQLAWNDSKLSSESSKNKGAYFLEKPFFLHFKQLVLVLQ